MSVKKIPHLAQSQNAGVAEKRARPTLTSTGMSGQMKSKVSAIVVTGLPVSSPRVWKRQKEEAATLGLTPTSRVNVVGEAELTEVLRRNEDAVQSLWSPQWGRVSTVGDAA